MTGLFPFILPLIFLCPGDKNVTRFPENQTVADLTIEISGLKNAKGKILLLLFSGPAGFPDQSEKSIFSGDFNPGKPIRIPAIPEGNYALTLVHDEDGNGRLNTNFLGVPQEGYSFSNARGKWLERPEFTKAVFAHRQGKVLTLRMIY